MKNNKSGMNWATLGLAMTLAGTASAESERVGGGLRPGIARPPLHLKVERHAKSPPKPPATAYSPGQIRHAYGVDLLNVTGSGQKIAIVDAYGDGSIQNDLNTFSQYYGLAAATVQILYPQGKPRGSNSGWALETALDVEWAHALAPKATIIVSVAKSASINDLLGAVDAAVAAGANVVSMSWGASEFAGQSAYDSHFNKPGITFVASAGDSGESTAVEWPAVSPLVIGVGGTSLYLDASGNRTSAETAWSSSGGGISTVNPVPSYQTGWQAWGGGRGVPDVSLVGDPNTGVAVFATGTWYQVGGTSVGAPQWAAIVALSNQAYGSPLTTGPAALYSLAGSAPNINSVYFLDISGGNNGADPDDYAVTGYDLVTGLGSPMAAALVPSL